MQTMRARLDATRPHRHNVPAVQIVEVVSDEADAMKATWRGAVTVLAEKHGALSWSGAVKATDPIGAIERAVRAALSGQPRRADAAFEVTVTLHKEDAHV